MEDIQILKGRDTFESELIILLEKHKPGLYAIEAATFVVDCLRAYEKLADSS